MTCPHGMDAVNAALTARVNAHDAAFAEIKSDVRAILATTVQTNLAIAVLPTWENVKARDKELEKANAAISADVQSLKDAATESRGKTKVLLVVAGLIGSALSTAAGAIVSYFTSPGSPKP